MCLHRTVPLVPENNAVNMRDLIRAVRRMRYEQQRYFANRQHHSPKDAMRAEREVDRLLAKLPPEGWDAPQGEGEV